MTRQAVLTAPLVAALLGLPARAAERPVGRAGSADADRWIQLCLEPRSADDLESVQRLGWQVELDPLETAASGVAGPPAWSLYAPAAALTAVVETGIRHAVVHPDLGAFYRTRLATPRAVRPLDRLGPGSMGGYFTLAEAIAEMDALAAAYPALVAAKTSIGTTVEGRSIWAFKLSANAALDEDEPELVILALMHAREPIGMMSVVHLAARLLAGYGTDPESTYLLDHRELWLIPVLNADGYSFNQASAPGGGGMWRKNRVDNGDGSIGVDLNRNFAYEWGHDDRGSSPNPSSDTYRGPRSFSEPETAALREFVIARAPAIAVNTHAYGDYVIRPWGYADLLTADDAVYEDLSWILARGNAFKTGNFWQTLGYLGNGEHDAYMYGETIAKPRVFGFTPEVGNSNDGFWPAADRILPLVDEAAPMHRFFMWAAGAAPRLAEVRVDDSLLGDGDGVADSGESFALVVEVKNHGLAATWGDLRATLVSDGCVIRVDGGVGNYGPVGSQLSADNASAPFAARVASAVDGSVAPLRLLLSDDRGAYPEIPLELRIGNGTTLFSDDFEAGTAAWVVSGWRTEPAGGSGVGVALSDSPAATYGANADVSATIAASLDLSTVAPVFLDFAQRFWIDNDFDAGRVEVSYDGGLAWVPVGGTMSDLASGVGAQVEPAPVYDGRVFDWRRERVDLTPFSGNSDVRLRFRLRSDEFFGKDGWMIDDVRVVGYAPLAPALRPRDPRPLLAVAVGADVVLSWPVVAPGPTEGAVDSYTLHRSSVIRASHGFAAIGTVLAPSASDLGVVTSPTSLAYQVVGENCRGPSSVPPP